MNNIRFTASIAFALVLLLASTAMADVPGNYTCNGVNPDGTKYTGRVTISRAGEAYNIKWTIGTESHAGIAIRSDNHLAATWVIQGVNSGGVVVYKILNDGRLVGKWVGSNGGRITTETLTPR